MATMVAEAAESGDENSFTVESFEAWCSDVVLDNGDYWELEEFQREIVADLFAGYSEVWTVIPEGNGKTSLMAGIALHHGDHTLSAFVPIGASSREQAEIMYRQAEGFVFRTPKLKDRFKCQEGYRRIKCLETGGRIQVYAADDRTADGVIPTLAILDELHRHRDLRLYRTWMGKLRKRKGQIVAISTAGEPESEFEETRARILKNATDVAHDGCHTRAASAQIVLHDWSVPKRELATDFDVVKQANPLRSLTVDELEAKHGSDTMTEAHWLRFVCNIATRPDGTGIAPEDWDALADSDAEPSEGATKYGFLDVGWKIDTTAMGILSWESHDRRLIYGTHVLEPPVDEAGIVAGLLDLWVAHSPTTIVYDPGAGAQQLVQMLVKGTHPLQVERGIGPLDFTEHTQGNPLMALAGVRFDEAIRAKWLVHTGDPELRRHVLSAVQKSVGNERWKYDRPQQVRGGTSSRSRYPIDLLTGVLMAHSVAVAENAKESPGGAFFL